MRYLTVLFVTASLASSASALSVSLSFIVGAEDQPAGYITNEIWIDTEGADWLSAQIIVEPIGGLIYQDPMNPVLPEQSPNPLFFEAIPSLAFDSYVSNGVVGEECGTTTPTDLDISATKTWSTSEASMGWYTEDTDDIGVFKIAQITLQNTTQGGWSLLISAAGQDPLFASGPIINGYLPEPATLSLLALGCVLIRRRRK